ncbi:MAG: endonuclease V [Desulfobacterales bacterium]|jgi:deoxyribonuclease V
MIAAFDVHYPSDGGASAAAVLFSGYGDAEPAAEYTAVFGHVEDYVPGAFYRRELPCLLDLFRRMDPVPDETVIDGYVMLGDDRPGLGQHLFVRLGGKIPVIGVAKSKFEGACHVEVFRGDGGRPLYVTAAGMDPRIAADKIRTMSGKFRIPALLKRVDRLARRGDAQVLPSGKLHRVAGP